MNSLFHRIPLSPKNDIFHVVVEIPKNSTIKYEYNEDHAAIFLDRVFKLPVGYPENYGFFPQAWNKHDKDPMDAIVISDQVIAPGVVVPVRVVGIIEMEDTGEFDHKILCVPVKEESQDGITDLADIPKGKLENMKWFLEHYKDREDGKFVKIIGIKDKEQALTFLDECAEEYKKNHS